MSELNEKNIRKVLGHIEDPELKKSLTELGMVRSVSIIGGKVTTTIALTIPGCPMKDKMRDDITTAINEMQGVDSVDVKFEVMTDDERARLKAKLGLGDLPQDSAPGVADIAKRVIAIASGKGGVGKSTITVNLAVALARLGRRVGLLDADVYGFSIPHMLGVTGRPKSIDNKIMPLSKGENLQMVSMGLFVDKDEPIVWRGPLLHKAINQFLNDVAWSDLEYLLIDLPPGTGDVTITIAQAVPTTELLVVTTPQVTATHVAGRVAKLADQTDLSVIGVVENMAYLDINGERQYIFGRDGGKLLADSLKVPLIGQIPLMQSIREGADTGNPVAIDGTDDQIALFEEIARYIEKTEHR